MPVDIISKNRQDISMKSTITYTGVSPGIVHYDTKFYITTCENADFRTRSERKTAFYSWSDINNVLDRSWKKCKNLFHCWKNLFHCFLIEWKD